MPRASASLFTLSGCLQGARATLPILPGIVVFACAFGAAAVQKGLTFAETMAISAFVFAGASQMVALELWREAWSPATIVAIVAVTGVVNARMILMGAALQPWLSGEPAGRTAVNLFFLTDANWMIGVRYHAQGGRDVGVLLGGGVALWFAWVIATVPGYLAGTLVEDPRRFGLDLVMPVFFAAMLVPLWQGSRAARPWAVAGVVALLVHAAMPGYAFIIAGALAGAAAAALLE